MIIKYKFTSFDGQKIEGMRTELDRNYDDEEYALIFIEDENHMNTEGYFELNILKDEDGKLKSEGYVAEYIDSDQTEAEHITDVELEVVNHDFDATLAQANEVLLKDKKEILLEFDGEMYWHIDIQDKTTGEIISFAENDFESEVNDDIIMARNEASCKDSLFVVSYVGISTDYNANGNCDTYPFKTESSAQKKLKELRDEEISFRKKENNDYEILVDEEDKFRIGWCGNEEQVRIEIHKTDIRY